MADSLQDQLKALGLAKDRKPARNKTRTRKPGAGKPRAGNAGAGKDRAGKDQAAKDNGEMALGKAWALREREEKQSVEQARARKREEDRKRREINKAIRAIVKPNRLNTEGAEVARNFMFRERIRKVYVTPEQHKALGEGSLGLVYLSGGYHVLDSEHVEAVRKIAADHVVELASDGEEEEEFPVPDDLTW